MRKIVTVVCLVAEMALAGQEIEGIYEIMRFLGAGTPEEVSDDDFESLSHLIDRPLKLNQCSVAEMVASGLLDRYRAMSFDDYRRRHGYVFSLMELSMIDGFGEEFTSRISPFISLDSNALTDIYLQEDPRLCIDATLRAGVKRQDGYLWMTGLKSRIQYGDALHVAAAVNSPYGRFKPDALNYTAGVLLNSKNMHTRFILGDFNARFGQGLALRSGLSLSSLSSTSSFMKNPTGLSLPSSFTGNYAFTGVATETTIGRYMISGFMNLPGIKSFKGQFRDMRLMPAVNISRYGRYGHLAITHYSDFQAGTYESASRMSSLDTRWCIRGTDIFAEAAYDWSSGSAAALAGTIVPAGESLRLAAMLRYYPPTFRSGYAGAMCSVSSPTNEYGVSLSADVAFLNKHKIAVTLDCVHLPSPKKNDRGLSTQAKCQVIWEWMPTERLSVKARISERYRTWGEAFRTDMRMDVMSELGKFRINTRVNALSCSGWGLLSYIEGGYMVSNLSVWLRQGLFRIDDWDDRIYVYERSAPGAFNVPAYYGRGLWTALMLSARISSELKLYLRASYTAYPFMPQEKRKPGKAELELQSVFSF